MSYYAVEGKTRIQLRELANVLRTQLHLDNETNFVKGKVCMFTIS